MDIESLIGPEHAARVIWEVSGRMDLSRFEADVKVREGAAGRPCWPARLLLSVWIYGYTEGVASARAISRMMEHEPGLRWLTGDQRINAHTLADFRVGHKEALAEVFARFLAILEQAGLVDLKTLLHDGTKIRTVAGKQSLHRRKTLEQRLMTAREVVKKLDALAEGEGEAADSKLEAARKRAAREAVERMTAALEELEELESKAPASKRAELRVSDSEPEARRMKQPEGGIGLSYNVQLTTEAKSRMIVAVGVTKAEVDMQELIPALEEVKQVCGQLPERIVADGGYATRSNVEKSSDLGVELIAPWKDSKAREAGACRVNNIPPEFAPSAFKMHADGRHLVCPAQRLMAMIGERKHHGVPRQVFQARAEDCVACLHHQACCNGRATGRTLERVVESAAMKSYLVRMEQPETRELYKRRSEVAEFPNMWAKAVKKWRRFSVRGLTRARTEATWVALAYNVSQYLRLRPQLQVA